MHTEDNTIQQKTECVCSDADSHPLVAANQRLSLEMHRALNDLRLAERELKLVSRAAERDGLTGLPNRALFADRFRQAAALAHRNGHRMALLFLDLDNFKMINDTHGHQTGDRVLTRTANCLLSAVRESDTVSRHGGDEFLILLNEISQAADATLASSKIEVALEQIASIDHRQSGLTASIGISIYPDDGIDLDCLIDQADIAMYRGKMQTREALALHECSSATKGGRGEPVTARQIRLAQPADTIDDELQALQAQLDRALQQLLAAAASAEDIRIATERAHRLQTENLVCLMQQLGVSLVRMRAAKAVALQISPVRQSLELVSRHADVERHIASALLLLENM
jgi:diguanylate cyclase (GGDEF)-like protein